MKNILTVVMLLMLTSCASLRYGNFTQMSESKDDVLASDVTNRLLKIYPPARNTFSLYQKICDGFGLKLVEKLRQNGYGVVENVRYKNQANLSYVVDGVITGPKPLYRVSIYVRNQSMSRAYSSVNGVLKPVTAWSYKE